MSIWILILTIIATTLVCIVAQNFVTPEKRLERRIKHRATVREEQFLREMSLLLGPPLTQGNEIVQQLIGSVVCAWTLKFKSKGEILQGPKYFSPTLAVGIEIYEYQPTMFHNKMIIVDEFMVSVGSTNFDERSFRLNDEASLNIYDDHFGIEMTTVYETDLEQCVQYTLERWEQRKFWMRCVERLALLARTQL